MDSLLTGSVQSWLAVVVATFSPLIALIVGFEGADWFLRRHLVETCDHAHLGEPRALATNGRPPASLGRVGRRLSRRGPNFSDSQFSSNHSVRK